MKTILQISVLAMAAALAFQRAAADEVVYWTLSDPTLTDDKGRTYHASEAGSYEQTIDGARMAAFRTENSSKYGAFDREGYDIVYLDLYFQDGGKWTVLPGEGIDTEYVSAGSLEAPSYASLGTLGGVDLSEYSFAIELGSWMGEVGNEQWVLAAISDAETFADLSQYVSSEVAVQKQSVWSPDSFSAQSVPEPTGSLLLLIGGAVLALRRRRLAVRG